MKILTQTYKPQLSSSTGSLAPDYGIDSVLDDYPTHCYISDSSSADVSITFSSNADSLFIGSCTADSVTATFNAGDPVVITNRIDLSNEITWRGRHRIAPDVWIDIPAGATSCTLSLSSTFDVKNAITHYLSNGAGAGRMAISGSDVLHRDYPQLRLGTLLSDGSNSGRIIQMLGTGAGTGDIVLNGSQDISISLSQMFLPVSVGVIRVGKATVIRNPQTGMSFGSDDFGSYRMVLGTGTYDPGRMSETVSGSIKLLRTEYQAFMQTIAGLRKQPVPIQLLTGIESHGFFCRFTDTPNITVDAKTFNLFTASFNLQEVV